MINEYATVKNEKDILEKKNKELIKLLEVEKRKKEQKPKDEVKKELQKIDENEVYDSYSKS